MNIRQSLKLGAATVAALLTLTGFVYACTVFAGLDWPQRITILFVMFWSLIVFAGGFWTRGWVDATPENQKRPRYLAIRKGVDSWE